MTIALTMLDFWVDENLWIRDGVKEGLWNIN